MNVRQMIKWLLAVLVTAGLTIAPLATPAAAGHSMVALTTQAADMSDMTADMPCCPDKQKNDDCRDCPLLAICMLKVLQAGPSPLGVEMALPTLARLHPLDDVVADGLARPPPDHPPRHLV
ncbi:hypothetical protein ACFFWD_21055 [Bradyrhizobium erythrophlei]|uniref:hypothetical protein n=1 Tax=Bradyrhizobium erythrophlei TaxID=1437360 RepID=UPI0035F06489